jgi:signal transduction histidine kinase
VHQPRFLKTASFKLAAFYAVLFGASVVALAAVVYINATRTLNLQERNRIQAEAYTLRDEYNQGGINALMSGIRDRQRGHIAGGLDYTVYRSDGSRLYGNLPRIPFRSGWKKTYGPPDGDEPRGQQERLLVFRLPLARGLWLMVGDDVGHIQEFGDIIMQMFGWGLILTLTLAVGGGIALSLTFLRRIDSITRTAEAIIGGDIGQRIPLRGANDDIDRLAATLNHMLDRISALVESVRHVSSDIAHDLRTPLSRLRQTLEDGRRAHSAAEYERATERAIGEIDSILETFSALLRIAQIEAGTRRAGFQDVDFSGLLESLAQAFAPVAEDAGQTIVTNVTPGLRISGDRELLTQMVVNLVENAIRHTQPGTSISIAAYQDANGPVLSVADNGVGVPAQDQKRIFERFYRLERSRTTAGSGLGLSLVAAIASLHAANITASDNKPGLRIELRFAPHGLQPPSVSGLRLEQAAE